MTPEFKIEHDKALKIVDEFEKRHFELLDLKEKLNKILNRNKDHGQTSKK